MRSWTESQSFRSRPGVPNPASSCCVCAGGGGSYDGTLLTSHELGICSPFYNRETQVHSVALCPGPFPAILLCQNLKGFLVLLIRPVAVFLHCILVTQAWETFCDHLKTNKQNEITSGLVLIYIIFTEKQISHQFWNFIKNWLLATGIQLLNAL